MQAKTKTTEFAKSNPVLFYVGVAGGLYLVYKLFTGASNVVDSVFNGDPNIDDNVTGTGGGLDYTKLTITEFQAINLAQQLLDAMNAKQPLYGTDEIAIEQVFDRLKNEHDFLLVYQMFGEKDYNGNNSPPTGVWSNIDSYKKQNLVYWLKNELELSWLSNSTDKRVYNKVKNLVTKAGFAF